MHLSPLDRVRFKLKLAQAAAESALPTNQNLGLAPVLPDPAEVNASPMLISGVGDPVLIPEENRKVDQTLTPNSETRNLEVTKGFLSRYFMMADVPTRKKPNTGLQPLIADHMGEASSASHAQQMATPIHTREDHARDASMVSGQGSYDTEPFEKDAVKAPFDKVSARFPNVVEQLRRV